jgi:hypothetical protein
MQLMSENDRPREARPWRTLRWHCAAAAVLSAAGVAVALFLTLPRDPAGARRVGSSPAPSPAEKPRSEGEEALTRQLLASSVEVDLEADEGAGDRLWTAAALHQEKIARQRFDNLPRQPHSEPIEKLLAGREDLRGLPLLAGKSCRTSPHQARFIADVCRDARGTQADKARPSAALRRWLLSLHDKFQSAPDASLYVRALEHAVQIEEVEVRLQLVKTLNQVDGKEATQAIARRAVFDPYPGVRAAAVEALKGRDKAVARKVLLAAFRHPWPAAADHAALALAELRDPGAAPALHLLAGEPDPCAPFEDGDGKWKQRRLVRVNHLRNCLLCHPPSLRTDDVRGRVPRPGEPLPPPEQSYESGPAFRVVRADVTYFRPDFSLIHRVKKPGKWPAMQRFDYLVQAVELEPDVAKSMAKSARAAGTYPQREAVRWALETLERPRQP